MKEKHANIPVFIPHAGCPHRCVFCDQERISGAVMPKKEELAGIVERALATLGGRRAEIAFFGGSFTAIDRALMTGYLESVYPYVKSGQVDGIRLSTRPDCVSAEVLDILEAYGVTTIELGVQSMSDRVLRLSGRGHTARQSEEAFARIKERRTFRVVGQMMLGLPGSGRGADAATARRICACGADGARIYPTAVLSGTALEALWRAGKYRPLTLEEGVRRGADCLEIFLENGVEVLRMGLCAEESVGNAAVAGCYHPAYGEMVRSTVYGRMLDAQFAALGAGKNEKITVYTAPGECSAVCGYKKENKSRLINRYGCEVRFAEDDRLGAYMTRPERGNDSALKIT